MGSCWGMNEQRGASIRRGTEQFLPEAGAHGPPFSLEAQSRPLDLSSKTAALNPRGFHRSPSSGPLLSLQGCELCALSLQWPSMNLQCKDCLSWAPVPGLRATSFGPASALSASCGKAHRSAWLLPWPLVIDGLPQCGSGLPVPAPGPATRKAVGGGWRRCKKE